MNNKGIILLYSLYFMIITTLILSIVITTQISTLNMKEQNKRRIYTEIGFDVVVRNYIYNLNKGDVTFINNQIDREEVHDYRFHLYKGDSNIYNINMSFLYDNVLGIPCILLEMFDNDGDNVSYYIESRGLKSKILKKVIG